MKKLILITVSILCLMPTLIGALELDLSPSSKSAILIESSTGDILYEKDAHTKYAPASMTKIMTMLLIMEAIDNGTLKLDEIITISENASSMGGSQILLEVGEQMSVNDLLKGIAVASGNDAAVALAERIGGSTENFVNMMNDKVKQLGLTNTAFKNPTGLDAEGHYSTSYDMAMIAKELLKHEKILEYTSIYDGYLRENTDRKFWLVNTNKLVKFYNGADGLKTGYTTDAGYCLTATAKRNDIRVIGVVMGSDTSVNRNKDMTSMLDYAFNQYAKEVLITKGSVIKEVNLEKGNVKKVNAILKEDLYIISKRGDKKGEYTYDIKIDDLKFPIKKGSKIGTINVLENKKVVKTQNVYSDKAVDKISMLNLYINYVNDIFTGNINVNTK